MPVARNITETKKALMADLLRAGYPVRFRAMGRSMSPTIRHKEMVTVNPANASDVRPGDVVLYARGARVFAHRLVEIVRHAPGDEPAFLLRGDNQDECDRPVGPSAILGKVNSVKRLWRSISLDRSARGHGLIASKEAVAEPDQRSLWMEIGVTHYKPPGAAWAQLVILVVYADRPLEAT